MPLTNERCVIDPAAPITDGPSPDLGVDVLEDVQDCGITYHTRYYRQPSTSTLSRIMLPGVRGEIEGVLVIGFIGDHTRTGS